MSDFETPDIAKQRAKVRAEQNAIEQAGVYVRSYTKTINHIVTTDEVTAIANTIIKIIDEEYTITPIDQKRGSILIQAKIKANVDSIQIDSWLKQEHQKNIEFIEQLKRLQIERNKQDKEIQKLRQNLSIATNDYEKSTLKKAIIDEDRKFLSKQKEKEAAILNQQGKIIEAIALYSQSIGLDEKNFSAHFNRGLRYREQKNYQQAIDDFTKALELNPQDVLAYNERGIMYEKQGEYMKALQDYNKVIESNSSFSCWGYLNRGILYDRQKKALLAMADYNMAITLAPKFIIAYYNRGRLYLDMDNYSKAIHDLSKAIELSKTTTLDNFSSIDAYRYRGLAYNLSKQYNKAITDFTKVIELLPQDNRAYYGRGYAYEQLGYTSQSNIDYKKAQELEKNKS
ncbi:tetratricopeptide repeat protein [Selenomonas ruminantium]|uniref:tetratricopeptide repeat protein n=1 Tax=Selenomonas ruminantium TaxID=971 RepID=UPI0026ECC5E9|nr:tetratricopeptide repeat protein [Selenomonas ruminantium]